MPSTSTKSVKLLPIPIREWGVLRDLYRREWPRHLSTFYTIQNYMRWAARNPNRQGVKILTTDTEWQEHGTFLLEDRCTKNYNVHCNTLQPEQGKHLMDALLCLDKDTALMLCLFTEQVRPTVELYLQKWGVMDFGPGNKQYFRSTLFYLPKTKSRELKVAPVAGFSVKPLSVNDVQLIDDNWAHRYPGSDYLIHRIISYNITYGVFDKNSDNSLVGWVMQTEYGSVGLLYVDEKYRRKGLAEQLVCTICRKLACEGIDASAIVDITNLPAQRLFKKLGFQQLNRTYWYDRSSLTF